MWWISFLSLGYIRYYNKIEGICKCNESSTIIDFSYLIRLSRVGLIWSDGQLCIQSLIWTRTMATSNTSGTWVVHKLIHFNFTYKRNKQEKMYRVSGDKRHGEQRGTGIGRGSIGWVIKIEIERSGKALLRRWRLNRELGCYICTGGRHPPSAKRTVCAKVWRWDHAGWVGET